MRKVFIVPCMLIALCAFAQDCSEKAAHAQQSSAAPRSSSEGMPTDAAVNAFLHRMYGFDPSITWKVVSIKQSAAPNVAEVIYYVGSEPRATHLYITPDGKNAVAGQMLPFGADPFAAVRNRLTRSTTGIAKGTANSPVSIYVFSDLQCPHCKIAEPKLDKLQQDVPGVRLIFQQYPIAQIHPWAMKAAEYSDCIGRAQPEKAFAFNDSVFAQQDTITPENATEKLNEILKTQALDSAKISSCAENATTGERVKQSIDLGQSLDVSGTPSIFINGRKINGFNDLPYETLKQLVEFEAKQTK